MYILKYIKGLTYVFNIYKYNIRVRIFWRYIVTENHRHSKIDKDYPDIYTSILYQLMST